MNSHTFNRRRAGLFPVLFGVLAAQAATPVARADIEVGVFGGGKFYSEDGSLARVRALEDPNSALQHSGVFGLRVGYLPIPRLALEGELGISPTMMRGSLSYPDGQPVPDSQAQVAVIPIRAHLLINFLTGRVRPFALLGGGGHISVPLSIGALQTDAKGAIHAGAGLAFDVRPGWGLRFDGRFILAEGVTKVLTPEGEVLAAVFGHFGSAPPPPPPVVVKDSDGDGVPDGQDSCPDKAGPAASAGCPPVDSDGDGIPDSLDRCPTTAGLPVSEGCPSALVDGDGDGVNDQADRCPQQAGPAANGGCPDADGDGDGVVDRLDTCPTQAETRNGYKDDDGCPDELPAAVKQFTGTIQGVSFQASSAILTTESLTVLDAAVKVLKDNPSVRIEIAGHTDSSGDAEQNRALSQQRAEAVMKYLTEHGVAATQLTAKGYGPDVPLQPNTTPENRAKNRRVEFTLQK
ncbi:MAG TPA: OmpA family protein [Pseudomonadota bacterium]|nr:OmpA family protein [Pseudomonadota bacterium]